MRPGRMRFALYEEAGTARRHRLDMKTSVGQSQHQVGDRWKEEP